MPRLTKRAIDALEATGRDACLWDSTLPGFGARCRPGGGVTYIVQYRNKAGRSRRLSLGRHGVLAPDQARRLAIEHLGAVAAGRDPAEEKAAARRAGPRPKTVAEVSEFWLEFQRARVAKGKLRDRTLAEYERQLRREILPRLGGRHLDELAAGDAQELHAVLVKHPVLANRVVDLLSAIWLWGEARGFTAGPNPCRRVDRNEERRRSRSLTHEELARIGEALTRLTGARKVSPRVAALVRLIALTGCRPGEIKSLAWTDVDLERSLLHLRNSKTGDRDVWLADPARKAMDAVRTLPSKAHLGKTRGATAPSPWVFPSPRDPSRCVREFRKPWAAILCAAKIEQLEPYVLRHTFASESESLGHSPYLTSELLGHAIRRRDMTRGYVHHIPDDVRRASERVAERIGAALGRAAGS